jgi:four helix bundle protein
MYEPEKLKLRTKRLALSLIRLFRGLPRSDEARLIGKQLIRPGTSVAANYRAAGRARSRAEFIAKIGTVVEEIDETVFWIEMLSEAEIMTPAATREVLTEANELLAIFAASQRTARRS